MAPSDMHFEFDPRYVSNNYMHGVRKTADFELAAIWI